MDNDHLMKRGGNLRIPIRLEWLTSLGCVYHGRQFTSAAPCTGSRPLWQLSSTYRGGGSDRSVPPEIVAARSWGPALGQPPQRLSAHPRCAHQHFPKGPRHNLYRNDRGEHYFHSAPSNSSHALGRRDALYITGRRSSHLDYNLTRPSRLRSNPVNIVCRGNRVFSTIAPHRAAPLRCLPRKSWSMSLSSFSTSGRRIRPTSHLKRVDSRQRERAFLVSPPQSFGFAWTLEGLGSWLTPQSHLQRPLPYITRAFGFDHPPLPHPPVLARLA